ncbi:hypothetical protein [Leucobacter sp. OH1287]|uniref:hypothetical protein n=1 Tax=Leucobacter sp. OH1287 TaxID=2491049 RepID=UPI001F1B0F86|nr:hypothetical protein [Leucobacter sp. OH1287]
MAETQNGSAGHDAIPEVKDTAGAPATEQVVDPQASKLPPGALARDEARRQLIETDDTVSGDDFVFVTKQVSATEKAAVIAVLTAERTEETQRVKHVERIEREPWRRSQRTPRRIEDLL